MPEARPLPYTAYLTSAIVWLPFMIKQVRDFSKSWGAKILLALIALSFVFVGAQTDFFGLTMSRDIVSAGGRGIQAPAFKAEFDRWKQLIESRNITAN